MSVSKFFRYQGRLFEIREVEGGFPHSPPCFVADHHQSDGWVSSNDDPRDLLEIAMLGVRVGENGDPLVPSGVAPDLTSALAAACSEGWMWSTSSGYATHEKREDAARRIYQIMGKKESGIPQDVGAALYKRLKKINVTVSWSQPKKFE